MLKFILSLFVSCASLYAIETKSIVYKVGSKAFEGYIATPVIDTSKKKDLKPAILLLHDWMGLDSYAKKRAEMYAELGYVVLAADMYGQGIRAKNHEEASKLMMLSMEHIDSMLRYMNASLEELKKQPNVDSKRIAVVGYCFGGGLALHLAYSGSTVKAIVVFHGMLPIPTEAELKKVKVAISIQYPSLDAYVPKATVTTLESLFKKENINFEIVSHAKADHGFTRFDAPSYNKEADIESWNNTNKFLSTILK